MSSSWLIRQGATHKNQGRNSFARVPHTGIKVGIQFDGIYLFDFWRRSVSSSSADRRRNAAESRYPAITCGMFVSSFNWNGFWNLRRGSVGKRIRFKSGKDTIMEWGHQRLKCGRQTIHQDMVTECMNVIMDRTIESSARPKIYGSGSDKMIDWTVIYRWLTACTKDRLVKEQIEQWPFVHVTRCDRVNSEWPFVHATRCDRVNSE